MLADFHTVNNPPQSGRSRGARLESKRLSQKRLLAPSVPPVPPPPAHLLVMQIIKWNREAETARP